MTTYEKRMALKKAMGGRCSRCPERDGLEFHDVLERGAEHHGLGGAARLRWYRAEWHAGHVVLLCGRCHRLQTLNDRLAKRKAGQPRIAQARGVPFDLMKACAELWPDSPPPLPALGKNPSPLT
jgi:hypothetical protein